MQPLLSAAAAYRLRYISPSEIIMGAPSFVADALVPDGAAVAPWHRATAATPLGPAILLGAVSTQRVYDAPWLFVIKDFNRRDAWVPRLMRPLLAPVAPGENGLGWATPASRVQQLLGGPSLWHTLGSMALAQACYLAVELCTEAGHGKAQLLAIAVMVAVLFVTEPYRLAVACLYFAVSLAMAAVGAVAMAANIIARRVAVVQHFVRDGVLPAALSPPAAG